MKKQPQKKVERQRETYRGITLIARAYPDGVKGKAWLLGREIANAEGVAEADVLALLREKVDGLIVVESLAQATPYPDDAAYGAALDGIRGKLTEKQRTMLLAHARARRHALTGADLAESAGFPGWPTARQQYALVGRALGEAMLFEPHREKDTPSWLLMIAQTDALTPRSADARWTMRPQLVSVLEGRAFDLVGGVGTNVLSFRAQRG